MLPWKRNYESFRIVELHLSLSKIRNIRNVTVEGNSDFFFGNVQLSKIYDVPRSSRKVPNILSYFNLT